MTTKDLKKPHSSRWVGEVETWSKQRGMHRDALWCGEMVAAEWTFPHPCVVNKNQEGYLGSQRSQPKSRLHSPVFQHWEDKSP